jgi:hypothetical protein
MTNTDTELRPNRLPMAFYKTCGPLFKNLIIHVLNGFVLGMLDISRLNISVPSLIPKVPGLTRLSNIVPLFD